MTISAMDLMADLRERLRAAPSIVAIRDASGVSYRHLLRIRNDKDADITLSIYERVDKALRETEKQREQAA